MNRATYDRYLACFNARDYDGVMAFYAEEFVLEFAALRFTTREQVKQFYAFLHAHLDESIQVTAFVGNAQFVALEGIVRIEGKVDLTAEALAEAGYPGLFPLVKGQVFQIPQFIHYHLQDGRIVRAACAVC
jgi:hypothetical protein